MIIGSRTLGSCVLTAIVSYQRLKVKISAISVKSQQTSAKIGKQFAKQIVVLSILKVELDNLVDLKKC